MLSYEGLVLFFGTHITHSESQRRSRQTKYAMWTLKRQSGYPIDCRESVGNFCDGIVESMSEAAFRRKLQEKRIKVSCG